MSRRISLLLRGDEFDRLLDLAALERRRPQDQAAILLTQALRSPSRTPRARSSLGQNSTGTIDPR
jgi:hypothetical protein